MAQYQQQTPQETNYQPHNPQEINYQQPPPQQYSQHQFPQDHKYDPSQPTEAPNNGYTQPQGMYANEKPAPQQYAPGQQVHDHRAVAAPGSSKWSFGLFDCFSPLDTCCLATWCPCYLFGKTYKRNQTGEADPSGFNGMCCAWLAIAYFGCQGILQCVKREEMRERHGIEGGAAADFCASCCCTCCTLVQEEKESVVRVTGLDPKTKMPYQKVQSMDYPHTTSV